MSPENRVNINANKVIDRITASVTSGDIKPHKLISGADYLLREAGEQGRELVKPFLRKAVELAPAGVMQVALIDRLINLRKRDLKTHDQANNIRRLIQLGEDLGVTGKPEGQAFIEAVKAEYGEEQLIPLAVQASSETGAAGTTVPSNLKFHSFRKRRIGVRGINPTSIQRGWQGVTGIFHRGREIPTAQPAQQTTKRKPIWGRVRSVPIEDIKYEDMSWERYNQLRDEYVQLREKLYQMKNLSPKYWDIYYRVEKMRQLALDVTQLHPGWAELEYQRKEIKQARTKAAAGQTEAVPSSSDDPSRGKSVFRRQAEIPEEQAAWKEFCQLDEEYDNLKVKAKACQPEDQAELAAIEKRKQEIIDTLIPIQKRDPELFSIMAERRRLQKDSKQKDLTEEKKAAVSAPATSAVEVIEPLRPASVEPTQPNVEQAEGWEKVPDGEAEYALAKLQELQGIDPGLTEEEGIKLLLEGYEKRITAAKKGES